jgi:hypothetical protein
MNMAIWKARLKMASPDTRRAIEKDLNDRIYKLQKLKTDMITAKQEGNQDLLMKTMELIQRDKASRNTLAGQRVRTAGGLSEQRTQRLIQFENSGPTGAEANMIAALPERLSGPLSKLDRNLPANALLDSTAMASAFTQVDSTFEGALTGANTQLEVDRVAGDVMKQIMRMNTGSGDRGKFIKGALLERLARTISTTTNVKYDSGADMYSTLTYKYTDRALGLTPEELSPIMGYGASAFDPSGLLGGRGVPSSATSIQSASTTIDNEIARLRDELALAKTDTAASKKEFDWLMRGGMGNMALRPVGSKLTPSPIAEYVRGIGDLYQADPEYAKKFLDAGDVATAGAPTPFQEQLDDPTKKYMSGVDYLQNSVNELKEMFGPTTPYAPETAKKMARQKLLEMANAIKSVDDGGLSIVDISELDQTIDVKVGDETIPMALDVLLEEVERDLSDTTRTEEQKQETVDNAVTALTSPEGQYSGRYLSSEFPDVPGYREKTIIGMDLGDRLKSAIDSKDAGDSGSYYGQITQLYNDIVDRPESTWGGLERSLVNSVQQNLLNPESIDSDVFDFKMQELVKPEMLEPDYGRGPLMEEQEND